jgi:hypothetical protein
VLLEGFLVDRQKLIRQHTSAYVSECVALSAPALKSTSFKKVFLLAARNGYQHTCRGYQHTSAYVSIRQHSQHTSAYVSIRQHTSGFVSIRQHTSAYVSIPAPSNTCRGCARSLPYASVRQDTSAYARIRVGDVLVAWRCVVVVFWERQHTLACASIHQHTLYI